MTRVSGEQGGSPFPLPGHSASMCCRCLGSIEDVIQRKESMAKKQGLQTPSIAHTPPLMTLNRDPEKRATLFELVLC